MALWGLVWLLLRCLWWWLCGVLWRCGWAVLVFWFVFVFLVVGCCCVCPGLLVGVCVVVACGWFVLFFGFFGEFDPGSGRTLAACLTHASRTGLSLVFWLGVG